MLDASNRVAVNKVMPFSYVELEQFYEELVTRARGRGIAKLDITERDLVRPRSESCVRRFMIFMSAHLERRWLA